MGQWSPKVMLTLILVIIIVSVLEAAIQGFSFPLSTYTGDATAIAEYHYHDGRHETTTLTVSTSANDYDGVNEVKVVLDDVIEELRRLKDTAVPPDVKKSIGNAIKSLENASSLLKSLEALTPTTATPTEIWIFVNKTLSDLKRLLDELRDDIETLKKAKMALSKIEAVASVIADKALKEAEAGNMEEAKKLAWEALNLTNGVINAYYKKSKVFETYATAFKSICEGLAELIRALSRYSYG